MKTLLDKLMIDQVNPGACSGIDGWIHDESGPLLTSYNPTSGEAIASVAQATAATYDRVVQNAQEAFLRWRLMPTPKRGLVVRDWQRLARACRPLGELVSWKWAKSRRRHRRSAGDDRHLRFCCRPLAAVVRADHALRAARSPHVRAVAPARPHRHHHLIQLPRGGLVVERRRRRRLRRYDALEAVLVDAADRHRGTAHLQPRHGRSRRARRVQPRRRRKQDGRRTHAWTNACRDQLYGSVRGKHGLSSPRACTKSGRQQRHHRRAGRRRNWQCAPSSSAQSVPPACCTNARRIIAHQSTRQQCERPHCLAIDRLHRTR